MKVPRKRRSIAIRQCIIVTSIAAALMLPLQAQAISCAGQAGASVQTAGPLFLNDDIILRANIGPTEIEDGNWMEIPQWSHFLDCGPGQGWFTCTDQLNDVEFLEVVNTDCVNGAGDPIMWFTDEGVSVVFTATTDGTLGTSTSARIPSDSTCFVDFKVRVNTLDPNEPKIIYGAPGYNSASCDNGLTGQGSGSVAFAVEFCSIDLTKEVSVDGGTTWFDANSSTGPNLEYPPGNALYQLIVENTGTTDYVEPIHITDGALGIDTTIPLLAADAQVTVGFGTIPELNALGRCVQSGAIENISEATGVCRADALVDASDIDNAWVNCVAPPEIDILKEVSVDGGATWYNANIPADYPPAVEFPHGAMYRVTVTNTGAVDLVNVTVDDPELSIAGHVVGNLAAGASVLLGSGDIPALDVAERCAAAGPYTNTAFANGDSAETGTPATEASDPATMVCVPPPEIDILKEVSVDGGATWYNANIPADYPPAVEFPHGAMYRVTVTNTGAVDLVNVTVDDPELGIAGHVVGNLAAGASVLLGSGDIPALDVAERCAAAGPYTNTAFANGDSAETGTSATEASDPATMECVPPGSIAILKEVSVDAGATWYNANIPADYPPAVEFPHGAMYRVTVTNTGAVDLVNVTVDDPELSIAGHVVGNLAAGASVLLGSGDIPALDVAERCAAAGPYTNTAFANGDSAESGLAVPEASDPATMVCVPPPEIDILKEVSVDAGATWYNANIPADYPPAVEFPHGAMYRVTVTNTGAVDLVNVTVDDPELGIAGHVVGNLAAGASVLLGSGDIPALDVLERCDERGTFTNVAFANGDSAETGTPATEASDPASMVCIPPPGLAICRTPGFWGSRGGDALDDSYKHGRNVTLDTLNLRGGVEVCGQLINNTDLESSASAIEAICINKGDPMAKYIRMATSAALNCNLADCGDIQGVLDACNTECMAGNEGAMNACAGELGCFNEGGVYVDGECHFAGTCHPIGSGGEGGSGQICSFESDKQDADPNLACGISEEKCYRVETCHERELCPDGVDGEYCWEPLGPASSPKKCNKARKNGEYIFEFPGWPTP